MRKLLSIAISSTMAFSAHAYDRIPSKDGFKGFVFVGGSSSSAETNTVAKISGTDVSKKTINSLDNSPDSESYGRASLGFNLSYTLTDSRTQFIAGTEVEDFLTSDFALGLGVRQGIGHYGNLRATLLASIGREVWEDPYVVDAPRHSTDETSNGARLEWEHILQSDFDLAYTQRKIDVDDEWSGATSVADGGLALTPAEQSTLDRNGDVKQLRLSYRWEVDADNLIEPSISSIDYDLDGDAVSMDGYQLKLDYTYLGFQDWEVIGSLLGGSLSSDDYNPIYGKKQDLDSFGVSLGATYEEPFGLKDWKARAAMNYGKQDSNIDFYETSIKSLTLGMLYAF